MIAKEQAKILREFVGSKYSTMLDEYFREKEVRNRNGNFFTKEILIRVFNGKAAHATIEKYIWNFIEDLTEERKAEEERQKDLLNTAKQLTHE